jgi:dipeptidyl aminopeptidase/acylaminoacyl peptidase
MTGGGRWSPDGRSIVFVNNEAGQQEVYLTTPEGQSQRRLTDDEAHDSAPSFSRDGRWIYFASNRDGAFQVWKVPADGRGPPVRVTRNGGYSALESPDGRTLYYGKRGEEAAWSLWSVPVGGGEETLLLPRIATWGDFDVGADGIYYIDTPRPGPRILFHPFNGSAETLLGPLGKRTSFGVALSPDERALLYTQYDQESTELMLTERFR